MNSPLLEIKQISVSFDGFLALNDLNLVMNEGDLRAVIGPNGAGKTTFLDVITGKVPPYSVVVPGSIPSIPLSDGSPAPSLYCAVIVKTVDERTRSKTSINELLRD